MRFNIIFDLNLYFFIAICLFYQEFRESSEKGLEEWIAPGLTDSILYISCGDGFYEFSQLTMD